MPLRANKSSRFCFVFFSALFSSALFLLAAPAQADFCHLDDKSALPPAGFGAAYNAISVSKELLLKSDCGTDEVAIELGSGGPNQYIYEKGYIYRAGSWRPISFTAAKGSVFPWHLGQARATIALEEGEFGENISVIAYVCQWTGLRWKCGCRDLACANSYWQLQRFKWAAPSCSPTCAAAPGCRATAPDNTHSVAGDCCGSGNCYACDTGYSWNGTSCAEDPDNIKPQVTAFSASPTALNEGDTTTASYIVTDNKALQRVELWRTTDSGGAPNVSNWTQVNQRAITGTTNTGTLTDIPPAGVFWYGMHVVDAAGNYDNEGSLGPLKVTVTGLCTENCTAAPGCRATAPANSQTTSGVCCAAGESCYACQSGYAWDGTNCVSSCSPTCTAAPGCRASLANGIVVSGECCGSGNCYVCATGYSWDGTSCVAAADTVNPQVTNFTISPISLTAGNSITASFTVTDNTALQRAELWRAPYAAGSCDDSTKTGCSWGSAPVSEQAVSGTSRSGTLTDTPPAGTFWYGLHAVDAAENWGAETAPVKVTVVSCGSNPPVLGIETLDYIANRDKINSIGAKIVRLPLRWGEFEPSNNNYQFANYDNIIANAENYGIELLFTVRALSDWGTVEKPSLQNGYLASSMPLDMNEWREFLRTFVSRYKDSNTTISYEIENEVNAPSFWQGTIDDYALLLEESYSEIKAADADAKVLAAAFACGITRDLTSAQITQAKIDFQNALSRIVTTNSFDALAVHNYYFPDRTVNEFTFDSYLAFNQQIMAAQGINKPIWITESGYVSAPTTVGNRQDPGSPDNQEKWLRAAFSQAGAAGIEKMIWLLLEDRNEPYFGSMGLSDASSNPRPANTIYNLLSECVK